MKMLSTAVFFALTTIAFTRAAHAQPTVQPEVVARIVAAFDANRDGTLDPQEMKQLRRAVNGKHAGQGHAARRQARFARALARFDRDRDGRLAPHEVPAKLAKRLARFDHNRDGWVDDWEIAQPPLRQAPAQYVAPSP
jgi:EF hand